MYYFKMHVLVYFLISQLLNFIANKHHANSCKPDTLP